LLYSVLDQSADIKLEHLRAALATWRYCEDSARFIFGDSLEDPTADKLIALLRANEAGMTRNALTDYFGRNKSSNEIGDALALLKQRGLARNERRLTGGREAELWKAAVAQGTQGDEKNEGSAALARFSRCENLPRTKRNEPKSYAKRSGA